MPRIIRDYKCSVHGYFEAYAPICPEGCEENIMIVHLQAPGLISDKTKGSDKNLRQLANDFKMSDIKSTREGDSQAGYYTRNNDSSPSEQEVIQQPAEPQPRDSAIWGTGMKGLNLQSIISGKAVQSIHGEPVGIRPKDTGNLTGPRVASYTADHENLSIKK
jgi:hypothetical protein